MKLVRKLKSAALKTCSSWKRNPRLVGQFGSYISLRNRTIALKALYFSKIWTWLVKYRKKNLPAKTFQSETESSQIILFSMAFGNKPTIVFRYSGISWVIHLLFRFALIAWCAPKFYRSIVDDFRECFRVCLLLVNNLRVHNPSFEYSGK